MRRLPHTVLLVAAVLSVAACQRTVSPEGYVSETPVEAYVRNLPKGYGGQQPVVLKPPMAPQAAPVMAAPQSYVAPAPYYADTVVAAPMPDYGTSYTSQPLPPPVMMPPSQTSSVEHNWNALDSYNGSLPPQELSPVQQQRSYAPSPVVNSMMPPQPYIAQPSAIITREVNYGREITVYPLDRADAPMPYIPPATTYQQPVVKTLNKPTPAGLNK